jgi:DNA-binding CsgD family transcriptional regulator
MLETIREFGLERLEAADETAAARAAHAQAMLSLAEAGAQGPRAGRQAYWLSRLGQNHDNLRAALGWLADQGENTALLRLTAAPGRFWYMHGHLSEGLAWVERALSRWEGQRARWQSAHPPAGFPENERQAVTALAGCLNAGGLLARYQCDYRRTVELCEESLRYCRMLADPHGITTALEHLAAVARTGGNHTAAQAMYAESLAICRTTGDELGTAWTTLYIAIANWFAGDLDLSLQQTQDALASFRRIGAQWETASALVVCAAIHRDRKEYQAIDQLAEEALHIKQRMGDQIGIGLAQNILGENRMVLNDHAAALLHLREAITIFEEVGSRNNYASTIRILAELAAPWFPDRAVQMLAAVETAYRAINFRPAAAEREEIDNRLADLRARLPEGQFSDNWAAGSALPPAALSRFIYESIDLALRETARESAAEPVKPNPYNLTAREIEVLGLIAGGLTDADAAARLVISRRTVSTHMTSIFNKLGVPSRLAAVRVALDQKLIEGVDICNFRDRNP